MSDAIKTVPTLDMLRDRREQILALAEKYGAFNVRVFGSVARGEATADSDIDFLMAFQDWASLYDLSGLLQDLQALLGYRVDVVEDHARMKERFKRNIMPDLMAL